MKPTLRRGWLQRFLGRNAQEGSGHIEVFNEAGVEISQEVQALRQANLELSALAEQLKHQVRLSTAQQSAMAKRIQAFADDWPALYKRYFTNAGDGDRAEGRKTRTKRKAKRRDA